MTIRPATYRDLSTIYSILPAAFQDDPFQNALMPYRKEHPQDWNRAWRHAIREAYWDYSRTFMVSCDVDEKTGREVIKAVAVWVRYGDGWESLWGIKGRWDPRLLIRRVLVTIHRLHRTLFPNRASIRPTLNNPKPLTKWTWLDAVIPYAAKYFTPPSLSAIATGQANITPPSPPPKQPTSPPNVPVLTEEEPPQSSTPSNPHPKFWELGLLGTHPASHGQGHGRALVKAGLARARADNLPSVVVAAENKEGFYQRSGFWNLVGWATEGEDNPIRSFGVGGGAILWTEGANGETEPPTKTSVQATETVTESRTDEQEKDEDEDVASVNVASSSSHCCMSASRSSTVSSFEVVSGVWDGGESEHRNTDGNGEMVEGIVGVNEMSWGVNLDAD